MPDTAQITYINACAPLRICDNGGWTDTWFAGHGQVLNFAVTPCAQVQIACSPKSSTGPAVCLNVLDYHDRYWYIPGAAWERHPLLEAAISLLPPPPGVSLEISLHCDAPAGASIGTSAAVCVALLGALDALTPGCMSAHQIAYAAHRVETELLGQQCGIQDQLCSAYGGVNYIEMHSYPQAAVTQIALEDHLGWELERRLVLIYLGSSHQSSQVHKMVITALERQGKDSQSLAELRQAAGQARAALQAGDLVVLGKAMIANTAAQSRLHPDLVSQDAWQIIAIARKHHALGWKVNGAGGQGGSLTLLCGPDQAGRHAMLQELRAVNPKLQFIPIQLSQQGLRVWRQELRNELA